MVSERYRAGIKKLMEIIPKKYFLVENKIIVEREKTSAI